MGLGFHKRLFGHCRPATQLLRGVFYNENQLKEYCNEEVTIQSVVRVVFCH